MHITYKLYHLLVRIPHKILSYLNIYWENAYLLTQEITEETISKQHQQLQKFKNIYDIKELTYSDFLLGDKNIFTSDKLKIIKERFNKKEEYIAFGIIKNNKLIYSCWLHNNKLILSYGIHIPLAQDYLFLDDYCSPECRGLGIHTNMNFFRLEYIHKNSKHSVAVLVHTYNTPAIKSQLKAGFNTTKKILAYKIGNKTNFRIKEITSKSK